MHKNNDIGCFADTHGKVFEIILLVGFLIGIASLTANLIFTLWCFKYSLYLFIIEIVILALNVVCFILTIILRIWRSDGSVFFKNFSFSNYVSIFILFLVIMNFISTIVEIFLFLIVINYLNVNDNCLENLGPTDNREDIFFKILNKLKDNNYNKLEDDFCKNRNTFSKIPWIALSANSFIQFLMFIFILIIRGRIKRKSDFGFPQINNNQLSQRRVTFNNGLRKKTKKRILKRSKKEIEGANSENSEFREKKKNKKNKNRRGSKKQKY